MAAPRRLDGRALAIALVAAVGVPAPSPPTTTSTTSTTSTTPPVLVSDAAWIDFDERLSDRLVGAGDQAASVAVAIDGVVVHTAAYGTRDPVDPADPATTNDRFRIASISKLVTSTVVLRLVDDGRLGLDDPVGARLAALVGVTPGSAGVASVTVRQLLSHTSGLPDYRDQFFGDRFSSCEEAAAHGLSRPLAHTPGTVHDYSNMNFCLLGLLVADLTGMPSEEAVHELLLDPLDIDGMHLAATFDPDPNDVVHVSRPGRTYLESLGGAGAWVATPTDLVRILDSLDPSTPGWHPLPLELTALMTQAVEGVIYPDPGDRKYGLGVVVWPDGSYGHTGTVENTHAMLVRRPDGVTWCILVSGNIPESTESLRDVFESALQWAGVTLT